jgi:DNA modification methylase
MARRRGAGVRAHQREHVQAREQLERAWFRRVEADPSFADLVTGEHSRGEPYHRWLPFRQQFGPPLVRRFLAEAAPVGVVLDPFSGSGTVAIECARGGRGAVGVEALPVLAWIANARFDAASDDRLASVLAAGRGATGDGRARAATTSDPRAEVATMIAADRARPIDGGSRVAVGDARALPLANRSIGGVLTSPPYLSRYDYTRITGALDAAWRAGRPAGAAPQMRATLRSSARVRPSPSREDLPELPAAALEAVAAVDQLGRRADAKVVRAYFEDLTRVLAELYRVTTPGAPVWIVIGAADFLREYVPADLIAAEIGVLAGFSVAAVVEARRLRGSGRRLGGLEDVAPRECIVQLTRPNS